VAEHGDRHHGPDRAADLEPGTDGHAVQQAVPDQRGRGKDAEAWGVNVARVLAFLTFVPAVDRQRALDDCKIRKPSTAASMTDGTPNSSPGCWLSASGTRSKPTTPSMSPAESPRA
jgi:hypothetical protein